MTPEELFSRLAPSVFVVESLNTSGEVVTSGSGVSVAPGYVVTNKHVIRDGVSFRVKHSNRIWRATISHLHPRHDLCQFRVEELEAPIVSLRDASSINVGERVYAIGAPRGFDLTISEGLVSGLRKQAGATVIQTTAPISSGSSGGGLFDADGELVGITTYFIVDGQSLNFAVPADLVLTLEEHPFTGDIGNTGEENVSQESELEHLAHKKMDEGEYGEAVKLLRQALRIGPGNKYLWLDIGISSYMVDLYEDAVEALQEAIRLDAGFVLAWRWLGSSALELEKFDMAIDAYKETVRLKPDEVDVLVGLGDAYSRKELHEDAVSAYSEAVRINPEHAHAWYKLGVFYVLTDPSSEDAISALRQAVRLEPDRAYCWYWLALAYRRHQNLGDAQREAQALNRLDHLDPKLAREYRRKSKDAE